MGSGNSWMVPAGVMRPILFPAASVNQSAPSGPLVMPIGPHPTGLLQVVGSENSWMWPEGVMRPILFPPNSVNQRLPSGPVVIPLGEQPWTLQAARANSRIEEGCW